MRSPSVIHKALDATPAAMDVRDYSGSSKPGSEQDLFAEVLTRAIMDLQGPSEYDKDESIRLFTDEFGDYAKHRTWLCINAGIDPDAFIEKIAPIAQKAAETPIDKAKPSRRYRKIVDVASEKEGENAPAIN